MSENTEDKKKEPDATPADAPTPGPETPVPEASAAAKEGEDQQEAQPEPVIKVPPKFPKNIVFFIRDSFFLPWLTPKMMVVVLLVSTGLAVLFSVLLSKQVVKRLAQWRHEQDLVLAEIDKEYREKAAQLEHWRGTVMSLGSFQFKIEIDVEGQDVPSTIERPQPKKIAEVEIIIVCDQPDTCLRVKSRNVEARDLIVRVVSGIQKDDLVTRAGKARLQAKLSQSLSEWLPEGSIKSVYFTRLMVR